MEAGNLIMIDWITVTVGCPHSEIIGDGFELKSDHLPDLDCFDLGSVFLKNKRLRVQGSSSYSIMVKTVVDGGWMSYMRNQKSGASFPEQHFNLMTSCFDLKKFNLLQISGNPKKFLCGEGLTVDDMEDKAFIFLFVKAVLRKLDLDDFSMSSIRKGHYKVDRLDVRKDIKLVDTHQADQFIKKIVAESSLLSRPFIHPHHHKQEGFTAQSSTTGRLSQLKIYNKYNEFKRQSAKQSVFDPFLVQDVEQAINGVVRFELRMNSQFFRTRDIYLFSDNKKPFFSYLDDVCSKVKSVICPASFDVDLLPSHLLSTFLKWQRCISPRKIKLDMQKTGISKASATTRYWRHCKELRDNHGLNLAIPFNILPSESLSSLDFFSVYSRDTASYNAGLKVVVDKSKRKI